MVTSLLMQAPLRQGGSSREEEGGTYELYHSNVLAKSTSFSKLQTAALIELLPPLLFLTALHCSWSVGFVS